MLTITRTTEDVFKAVLDAASIEGLPATRIFTGLDNDPLAAPCVIVSATEAREDIKDSGIFRVRLAIHVKEIAKQTSNQSTLADLVLEALSNGSFNNITNYNMYDLTVEDQQNTVTGDAWTQTLHLEVVCVLTEEV